MQGCSVTYPEYQLCLSLYHSIGPGRAGSLKQQRDDSLQLTKANGKMKLPPRNNVCFTGEHCTD